MEFGTVLKPIEGSIAGKRRLLYLRQFDRYLPEKGFLALVIQEDDDPVDDEYPIGYRYHGMPFYWEVDHAWPTTR